MYTGGLNLTTDNVISILAAASLFRMQESIDECRQFMISNTEINAETAILYYNASSTYELLDVKAIVETSLQLNLLSWLNAAEDYLFLQYASVELISNIVTSPNTLCSEYFIYLMLKKW